MAVGVEAEVSATKRSQVEVTKILPGRKKKQTEDSNTQQLLFCRSQSDGMSLLMLPVKSNHSFLNLTKCVYCFNLNIIFIFTLSSLTIYFGIKNTRSGLGKRCVG